MVSPQSAINSPFGYRSTATDVIADVDLSGKTALVTGGYSGIGTETVRALASAGAHVIVGARRVEVAQTNLADMPGTITILPLDLANPTRIDAFANNVIAQFDQLDLLINNAAIMANPLLRDARGYESQLATNHLGHFQLVARLWSLLKASQARVIVLSSSGHQRNGLDLDDLHFEQRPYDKWIAYAQAKSANALFALSLDKLGEPHGVRAFCVHPGWIKTQLQRHLPMDEQKAMGWYDDEGKLHELFKTPEEGAATTIWCATSPLLAGMGGVYCEDCNIAEPWHKGTMGGVKPHVRDERLADALWAKSEELTDIIFSV